MERLISYETEVRVLRNDEVSCTKKVKTTDMYDVGEGHFTRKISKENKKSGIKSTVKKSVERTLTSLNTNEETEECLENICHHRKIV